MGSDLELASAFRTHEDSVMLMTSPILAFRRVVAGWRVLSWARGGRRASMGPERSRRRRQM